MFTAALLLALTGGYTVPTPEPLPVIGGEVAEACEWPTTVLMSGCSGTLVHPEIVLYAAHCPGANNVRFGTEGDDRTVQTVSCAAAPEYPATGFDYAYCRLAQPVTDVPIVPIMMGCERDQLEVGTRAWLVGFGNTTNGGGGFGTKRWIEGEVAGFPADGKQIGVFYDDPDTGICNGDSGGSAFAQLDDGTWRLFGIASTVPGSCGGSSQHIPAWAAAAWIEEETGLDITPCHDADGAWNPGPACGAFPTNPGGGNGLSWATGCGPGPVGEVAQTCGAPNGEPQDVEPPTLSFVSPASGVHPGPEFETRIELDVTDDSGILDVSIAFADETQALFEAPPYAIPSVVFPEGTWEIVATARDWSGNVAEASVTLAVGEQADDSSGGDDDSGAAETSGTGGGTSATTTPGTTSGQGDGDGSTTDASDGPETDTSTGGADEADAGCGCTQRSGAPGSLLLLLGLVALRRRR